MANIDKNDLPRRRRRKQLRAYYVRRCIIVAVTASAVGLTIGFVGGWSIALHFRQNNKPMPLPSSTVIAETTPTPIAPQLPGGVGTKVAPFHYGEVYTFLPDAPNGESTSFAVHISVEDFLTSQYYEEEYGDEYRLSGTEGAALLYIDTSIPFDTADAIEIGIETSAGKILESYPLMDAEISGNECTKVSTGKTNILYKRFKYEDSDLPLSMTLAHTSNGQVVKAYYLLDEPRYPIEPAVIESPTAEPMPTPTIVPYSTLEHGSRGSEVQSLQQRLIALGYLEGEADGIFGDMTQKAIQTVQESNGMGITGIADAAFQAYLYSDDAIAKE